MIHEFDEPDWKHQVRIPSAEFLNVLHLVSYQLEKSSNGNFVMDPTYFVSCHYTYIYSSKSHWYSVGSSYITSKHNLKFNGIFYLPITLHKHQFFHNCRKIGPSCMRRTHESLFNDSHTTKDNVLYSMNAIKVKVISVTGNGGTGHNWQP